MAGAHTATTVTRTTVTIKEIEMSWDDLYKELAPDIPWDKARSVKEVYEDLKAKYTENQKIYLSEISENYVRDMLEKKVADEGWNKIVYRRRALYWPPD